MSSRSFSTNDRVRNDAQTERSTESTVPRTTLQGLSNGVPAISVNGSGVYLDIQSVFSAVFSNPKWVYLPKNIRKLSVKASSWCQRLTPLMRNHWWNQDSEKTRLKSTQLDPSSWCNQNVGSAWIYGWTMSSRVTIHQPEKIGHT